MAGTPAAVRVWERSVLLHRNVWRASLFGSFLQPLLFLLGMGLGVGALVDGTAGSPEVLGGVSYVAFIAPALLASSAMLVCSQDSLWALLDGFVWGHQYRAMAATPVEPAQVADGLALWHLTRAIITVVGVAVVLTAFGDVRSWGLLVAVPAGVLTGLAFALPITAWTATRDGDASFPAIMRFAIIPMFLFAGVFYPIDQLPAALQPLAMLTPLYHGVELCRGAVLGTLGVTGSAVNLVVLTAYALGGWWLCRRNVTRRLTA